jgi:hypothetical protein
MVDHHMQTMGMFLSGYVYRYNPSYPWYVLSAALLVIGVLFILLVDEPCEAGI